MPSPQDHPGAHHQRDAGLVAFQATESAHSHRVQVATRDALVSGCCDGLVQNRDDFDCFCCLELYVLLLNHARPRFAGRTVFALLSTVFSALATTTVSLTGARNSPVSSDVKRFTTNVRRTGILTVSMVVSAVGMIALRCMYKASHERVERLVQTNDASKIGGSIGSDVRVECADHGIDASIRCA